MDDTDIPFTLHLQREIAQEVARKKCLLSASDARARGIALEGRD